MDIGNHSSENNLLKNEIQNLEDEIKELKENLTAAAEAGMALLSTNQELQDKYEEDVAGYQRQIEELRQENHLLSTKLLAKNSTHQAFLEELDQVKSQTEASFRKQIQIMEQNHAMKVQQLSRDSEEQRAEIERLEVALEKEKRKTVSQEGIIANLKEELSSHISPAFVHQEVSELEQVCSSLRDEKEALSVEITKKESVIDSLQNLHHVATEKVKELEEEIAERIKLNNEWYQELQEIRDENMLLHNQLEKEKLGRLEENWQSCGNSLFGEVEEKRLETERRLISLQVKYDTLERTHQTLKQHFRKLKAEMSALLCRHNTFTADASHVHRLQRTLQQRDCEIRSLTDQIYKLEKENKCSIKSYVVTKERSSQFEDKKEYIEYLNQQLEEKEELVCLVRKELELKNTQLLWETAKLSEAEAKLHKCEQEKAKYVNESTKTRMKLQEVKEKENDLKTQLLAADKEISTLKQQLKVKLLKGYHVDKSFEDKHETSNEHHDVTKDKCIPDVAKDKCIPVSRRKINLLEELEKESNSVVEKINCKEETTAKIKPEQENSIPNEIEDSMTEATKPLQPGNTSTPNDEPSCEKPMTRQLTVIKVGNNVNRCPQQ